MEILRENSGDGRLLAPRSTIEKTEGEIQTRRPRGTEESLALPARLASAYTRRTKSASPLGSKTITTSPQVTADETGTAEQGNIHVVSWGWGSRPPANGFRSSAGVFCIVAPSEFGAVAREYHLSNRDSDGPGRPGAGPRTG